MCVEKLSVSDCILINRLNLLVLGLSFVISGLEVNNSREWILATIDMEVIGKNLQLLSHSMVSKIVRLLCGWVYSTEN